MHCVHCGTSLPDGARFCAGCGQAAVVAPAIHVGHGVGPHWSYPAAASPQIRPGGEVGSVAGFIVAAVLLGGAWLVAVGVVLRDMFRDVSSDLAWWFMVVAFPIFLVWQGVSTMRTVRNARERTAKHWDTFASGTPCWGRIQEIVDGEVAYREGISYVQTFKITIETAFAAPVSSGAQRVPVGRKIADGVVLEVDAGRLPFQPAFTARGNWCAFILHPSDPSTSLVDAFANETGKVLPGAHG